MQSQAAELPGCIFWVFFWCFVQLFCLKPMLLQRRGCDSLGLTAVLCQYGIQTGKNWHSSLQTLLSFPLPCRSEAGIHKEIKTNSPLYWRKPFFGERDKGQGEES
uniref:Uncharacterized protein n=1 Tax=Chloebia gouldiae TaxID=44316 RepID=A0A3L8QW93_CHLGU|nr:hypothetical protein DV515_00017349 [Chloebia gouldiae]